MARAAKAVRIAAWIIGGLLAVVILLLALLHTPPARRYALRQAIEILEQRGVDLNAGGIDYNLLEGTATLEDVVIRSQQAPDLPPIFKADSLTVDLSLRQLFGGGYFIEDATIRNPQIHVILGEGERDNIPKLTERESTGDPVDFLIDNAVIQGGSVRFEDREQNIAATLPLERLRIDGNALTGTHEIALQTTGGGTLTYGGRTLPLTGVSAEAVLAQNGVEIEELNVGLGESKLALTGRIEDFDSPRFNLQGTGTLQLEPLLGFTGVDQTAKGTVQVAVEATGPLRNVKVEAKIEGENLTLDQFRDVDLAANLTYNAETSRIKFSSLNVATPSGTIRGTADIALNAEAGTTTVDLTARNLDLLKLTTLFDVPVKVASRADAEIEARFPGLQFDEASADIAAHLTPTRGAATEDVLPVQGRVNIKAAGDRIRINVPGVQTLDATATGQVVIANRRTLGGKLNIETSNLAETIKGVDAFLGREPSEIDIGGQAEIAADLGGTLQNPTMQAMISAPELNVGEIKSARLDAQATFAGGTLNLQNAVFDWRGQTFTASGTVGKTLDLTATTRNVRVESLLEGINQGDIPASGNLQIDARLTGSPESPEADLQISGSEIVAYNEPLGTLQATAELDGDVLTVQNFRIEKPQPEGTGTLAGSATYNTETKRFSIDAKSDNLQLTHLTLPGGVPVRGELNIEADVQGTAEDPTGTIQIAAAELVVGQNEIGEITATAELASGVADVDVAAPGYNLAADAQIGLDAPYPATIEVVAKNTDLGTLPVDVPVEGTVSAVVQAKGELANWQQGQAAANVSELNLTFNGEPLRSEGPLVATYQNQRLTIEQATLIARESRIQLQGTLPLEPAAGEGEIKLTAKLDLASLSEYLPEDQNITARGTALIDGTISGTLQRIDPNVTIALNDGYLLTPQLNPPLSGVNLRGQIQGGALELESLTASLGPADVTASGTIPFGILPTDLPVDFPRQQGPAKLTAELQDLDLGTVQALPDEVDGMVSARLELTATRPEIEALTGTLTFPTLRVQYGNFALRQQGTTTVAFNNGVANVEQLVISGPGTSLAVFGTAGLTGKRPLDIVVDGTSNAAILRAFTDDVRAEGNAQLHISLAGTVDQPQARGFVQLADASVSITDPRIGIENLDMRVELAGTQATITRLNGVLNGGDLSGGGTVDFTAGEIRAANLKLNAQDVYVDYPEGLKTMSDIDLSVTTARNSEIVVGGNVTIEEGGFTDDLYFDRGFLAALDSSRSLDLAEERNPLLERMRFNVGVRTVNPIVVDNNLAEAEIRLDVRLLGSPYQLGLSGRAEIEEGGELRLQEREYLVERGVILFTNERRIEPSLDILATTNASGYEIRLQIQGEPGNTETTLTSDPPLPEPSILALLITGRTLEDLRGEEFEVARNQVLSYLTGRLGGTLGRGIQSATGLSTVRIEPNLIAAETDPSARLTVGQNITRSLELIYSMDLRNSSDQIYVAEYDISRRFATRGVRQEDGSYRLDFRHDLRFGGVPQPGGRSKIVERRIAELNILGEKYFTREQIADKFDVEAGKRYDFFKVRKGVDRVRTMYRKENLLESRVRLRRQQEGNLVTLNLEVTPGPVVDFVYEGVSVPGDVQERVREIWHEGVFDTQRAEESVEAIRGWLMSKENRLRPEIEYRIAEAGAGRKRITFDIQPGPVFRDVKLVFEGAKAFGNDELRGVIEDQKLTREVYTAPDRVAEVLQAFYREMGYLSAEVAEPRYELDPAKGTGQVVFPVAEGPPYKVGEVTFAGNTVYTRDELLEEVPLEKGATFRPRMRQNALERLRGAYYDIGFNDVEAEVTAKRNEEAGTVDLTFRIEEGRQAVVASVSIQGNINTSESLVRSQVALEPGDILDFERLSEARRNLYRTGAFSLVEVVREEVGADDDAGDESTRARRLDREKPMNLVIRVHEIQPWQVRYGGFFDTERGPGGIADFANRNMLGSARVLGLRTRYDAQLREARLYFSQPELLRFPLRTIASPYFRQERNPATSDADPFNVDRVGLSIQQEAIFANRYILNYGYRLERSRTYDPADPSELNPFNIVLRTASLTATLSRDTRDDILDATRGNFFSHAFQYSPEFLGSQVRFTKYFGQFFHYLPLQSERVELFTNQILRPRLVYATAVRVGLANGLGGQEIPPSERFFAGGATTVRGFEQNALGPVNPFGAPGGGNAMFVLNNEIRFPVFSIFDGVGFVDVGNVYPTVSDFSLTDIRKTAGTGLRVRTPWFLIRFDYGLKLDRRSGESLGRFFFSIGQAF